MLVTIISQCKKKAHQRTRSVLDAFTERIGTNTWQSIITEQGLDALHAELRKTASKSTAVACHWNRSRTRTELLWIVGKKQEFNATGNVPVNETEEDIGKFMDTQSKETLFANTSKQPLKEHLFAVGTLASLLIDKLIPDTNGSKKPLKEAAYIAGLFHDIGKIDPQFQNWVIKKRIKKNTQEINENGVHIDSPAKFSFDKHPRHNEISLVIFGLIQNESTINKTQREHIAHTVLWHHAKPFRKDSLFERLSNVQTVLTKSLGNDDALKKLLSQAAGLLKSAHNLTSNPPCELDLVISENSFLTVLPSYKKCEETNDTPEEYHKDISYNARCNWLRASVVTADRLVSNLEPSELSEHIKNNSLDQVVEDYLRLTSGLSEHIESCLHGFEAKHPKSKRNQSQSEAADKLANLKEKAAINAGHNDDTANIGILQGPAGCGKTKIALEWALKTGANKIILVCPRVQVCLGLMHELTSEHYLPQAKVEIHTGEYKKIISNQADWDQVPDTEVTEYFTGDVVITTIDQIVNSVISHTQVTGFIDLMNAHVIFDEFHELIVTSGFNLLFAEIIQAKKFQGVLANTLLLSATPNYLFVEQILKLGSQIVRVESFNQSKYDIQFKAFDDQADEPINPLLAQSSNNVETYFIITNTARDAQNGFIKNLSKENGVLIHSKFTKTDKKDIFDNVYDSFKKDGSGRYHTLRAGPIVQASLNISCQEMASEISSPENWLQRLGRLNRFSEYSGISIYTTVIPETMTRNKRSSGCASFLNRLHTYNSAQSWYEYLLHNLDTKECVSLDDLYTLYEQFYQDSSVIERLTEDLLSALKASRKLINEKVLDPVQVSKKKPKDVSTKIKRNSLRGDNRFVQMAVCEIKEDGSHQFINKYAYNECEGEEAQLTESIDKITGYGDSSLNLLSFMKKVHHNIKGTPKAYKDVQYLQDARSTNTPIYLSYTPEDLKMVEGEHRREKAALYYAHSDSQPIGAIQFITKN